MPIDSSNQTKLARLEALLEETVAELREQEAKLKANTESWSSLVHLKDTLRAAFPEFGQPIDLNSPGSVELLDCNYLLVQNDIYTVQVQVDMKANYTEIKKILDKAQLIVTEFAEFDTDNKTYSEMVKALRGADGLVEPRADWEVLIKKLAALMTHAAPLTSPITLSEVATPTNTLPRDTIKPTAPKISEDHTQQINILKGQRQQKLHELVTIQVQVNKHLTDCCEHHLQITQLRLVFGAGNSVIRINGDGSINNINAAKIALTSELLEHDKNLGKSLNAFSDSQKKYFGLIREMKGIEMEIKEQLMRDDGMSEERDLEMENSQKRSAVLEQYRVQMTETWLEWLDELA
ncbi:hypothetical protein E4T39_06956 [Aureobasidium subglaciale]|nr:hypothetical protein E4T39_06956 [Aureobasidium subglaciale]